MEKVIEAIKEFFFDIIGFLFPGFIFLIIGKYVFTFPISINESQPTVVFIVAYIFGYLVFSLSQIKESLLKKISACKWIFVKIKILTEDDIIKDLSTKETFLLASKIIREKTIVEDRSLNDYKSLRNVAMSGSPDTDKKVYTFMFRAELFNQLHTISLIVLIALVIHYILSLTYAQFLPSKEIDHSWIFLF